MAGKLEAPRSVTGQQFAQSLAESGILDSAVFPADSAEVAAGDGATAAEKMVAAGHLTKYQAEAVLDRRFADLKIGNYDILDRLGAGGMGTVYKARHRRMKRIVALKVLSKEVIGKGSFAQRFQREVETIARLHHPNIVMAFDADEAECGPFLVMEFVDGRDLTSEVERTGAMAVADAVECVIQAARGLAYAHAQGIVHRDIKPANLLRDVTGTVKVADLGLARLNKDEGGGGNTSLTQAGTVVGTVDYMPPEQAVDSGVIDHRADIYSLGCSLYFLLTAKPPYAGNSIMAVMLKHRDAAVPNLVEARAEVSPELEAAFRRMVAKKPEDRYQTMDEVVTALEQALSSLKRADGPGGASAMSSTAEYCPLGTETTGELEASTPAGPPLEGRVVVLVEPSRTQGGIIRRYLSDSGARSVHLTGSGGDAISLARQERADVLITSMFVSDMTAVELVRAIRADPGLATLGVVIATSEADADHAACLMAESRCVFLHKPFDSAQLAEAILSVMN